jgi:hypothetical protein
MSYSHVSVVSATQALRTGNVCWLIGGETYGFHLRYGGGEWLLFHDLEMQ